ncbi:hypothetical protein [Dyadobacter sp. CY356]|uniref:hypothetical protein n=1 Tax=Dyadobacter sp. CY356 TaxID=2906442 RepID=UPI001F187671|nr:hypothetical protein [Dyadobacter sp. CY356]MCF0055510.1 hypothetical protein [Dyadobacter sp. CY356]
MTDYLDFFGDLAISQLATDLDHSTPDPFAILQDNPQAQLIYLIEAYPYDVTQVNTLTGEPPFGTLPISHYGFDYYGGVSLVCLSDVGFVTKPTDTLANKYFIGQVNNAFQFDVSVLSNDEFGNSNQSYGSIVIQNGNGNLDRLTDYFWSSRRVTVKAGAKTFRYQDFATIFDGAIDDFDGDDDQFTLTIKDNRSKTDQQIVSGIYGGTGGIDGGANIINTYKPLAYGKIKNAEPILVDSINLIYQIHDGSILGVDAVRDRGVGLTNGGDVPDIILATVAPGQFKTQLSGGYIKLGSTPAGRITMDVQGENGNGGYVSKTGAIIQRIVTTRLGLNPVEPEYIDGGSLNNLDAVLTGDVGTYINKNMTASDVISDLVSGVGAYWTFTRQGLLFAGTVSPPSVESAVITINDIDEQGIKLERVTKPAWRVSVGYAPAWTVQDESELASATTNADRSFVSNEYRYLTHEDRAVRGNSKELIEKIFYTNIANQADAQSLLDRLVSVYSTPRQVFQLTVYRALFKLYIGAQVRLIYNRFNLNAGKVFMVSGVSEDAETGATVFELWG